MAYSGCDRTVVEQERALPTSRAVWPEVRRTREATQRIAKNEAVGGSYALRRFGVASVFFPRGVARSRGKPPLHRALTQSSHSPSAPRGLKTARPKLHAT